MMTSHAGSEPFPPRSSADGSCVVNDRPRIAVGFATVGRPAVLLKTLAICRRQRRPADAIFVCAPSASDMAGAEDRPDVRLLSGPRGLPHQRNVILKAASDYDAVVFFDDDFVPAADYLDVVDKILTANPDIAVMTGGVVADGILGPGLSFEEAEALVAADALGAPADVTALTDVYNAYGCNMVVRQSAVAAAGAAFDEQLPLYAWLEDVDLSRQLAGHGRIVKAHAARGVHLGVKSGRQSGVRLGYSQIANPVYLIRKGTCTTSMGVRQLIRNILANVAKSFAPEPFVDRRGRMIGNFYALLDLARGRVRPSRALEL